MGSSNQHDSNSESKKNNNPLVKNEDGEESDLKAVKYSTFILQFFDKTKVLNLEKFEILDLDDFKREILKFLKFKKISMEQIALFYREQNKLGYKMIDNITTLWKLENSSIIKIKILHNELINEEKYFEKMKSDLITSMEIEDALIDNQKLKSLSSFDLIKDILAFRSSNIENLIKFLYNKISIQSLMSSQWHDSYKDFVISLFSKIFTTRGIKILTGNDKEKKDIYNRMIQNISNGFIEMKKFEFRFKTKDEFLIDNMEEYYYFTEQLRKNLSKALNIDSENIIFGPPQKGSIIIPIVFKEENIKRLNFKKMKEANINLGELLEIKKLPLYEYIYFDKNIFDSRYNNKDDDKCGVDEIRGKEKYIPPKGWIGFGLNVEDNYDGGEACWLCFGGIYENEFAVAYYPITEEDDDIFLDNNFRDFDYFNLIAKSINGKSRHNKEKTGKGTILYQNIELAEKHASFIDIDKDYIFKLVLMCRVNPNKIRTPEDYKEIWVLNPNSDEIRPYRILLKIYEKKKQDPTPKNFYQFYSVTKVFIECLSKKNESILNENINTNFSEGEYPIFLYKNGSGPLKEFLLFQKIDPNYTKEKLQSGVWCLYNSLTNVNLRTERMKLVKDNTIVYSGVHVDKSALNEEFQIGRKLYIGKFLSTSLEKKVAKGFTCDKGFLFIIRIKNNETKNYCYNIEKIQVVEEEGKQDNEKEILIIPFALFQITNIVKNDNISEIYLDCLSILNNN